MLQILFKKLRELEQASVTPTPSGGGGSGSNGLNGAFLLLDHNRDACCDETRWPWGPFGTVGSSVTPTSDPQWSVLTNGDLVDPELIFAGGDVVMLETF